MRAARATRKRDAGHFLALLSIEEDARANMPTIQTEKRTMALSSGPYPADSLIPERVSGSESLCALFSYDIDFITDETELTPADMLGKKLGVELGKGTADAAFINGYVVRLQLGDYLGGNYGMAYRRISCRIVPWFWFLDHTTDCRVFQNKTVQEILEALFGDAGFTDYSFVLQGSLEQRKYVIQYNETDYAFACRLMAEEGLVWWVASTADTHTLTITNHNDGLKTSGAQPLKLPPREASQVRNSFEGLRETHVWKPGKVAVGDSEFRSISTDLTNEKSSVLGLPLADKFELFVWPGRYPTKGKGDSPAARTDGEPIATHLVEALESEATRLEFTTESHAPMIGVPVEILDSAQASSGTSYLVERLSRSMVDETHLNARATPTCRTGVSAFPADKTYRTRPLPERPALPNLMLGKVVGPSGEEIHVDEYGRVKVQFLWDRLGEGDDNASCWMRLSQAWAGAGFGMMAFPRIGMEVIVGFLDDDPDHPVVLGCLHNNENTVPVALPDNKTQTGIMTRSSTGGGTSDYNALIFEDKAGSEKVIFQAQKDYERLVKNNEKVTVKVDRTLLIEGKQKYTVKGDYDLKVSEGNHKVEISKGNFDTKVGMGNMSLKVSMGDLTTKVDLGKIANEAMQAIELKVGGSSVKIDQMGVTIKGMMIKIEGTVMLEARGLMTKVSGDAMMMLKGGIIMIN
jgi:type VI secretion system secreted protein VgrG